MIMILQFISRSDNWVYKMTKVCKLASFWRLKAWPVKILEQFRLHICYLRSIDTHNDCLVYMQPVLQPAAPPAAVACREAVRQLGSCGKLVCGAGTGLCLQQLQLQYHSYQRQCTAVTSLIYWLQHITNSHIFRQWPPTLQLSHIDIIRLTRPPNRWDVNWNQRCIEADCLEIFTWLKFYAEFCLFLYSTALHQCSVLNRSVRMEAWPHYANMFVSWDDVTWHIDTGWTGAAETP